VVKQGAKGSICEKRGGGLPMYANSPTKSLQNPLLKMPSSTHDNFPSTPGKVTLCTFLVCFSLIEKQRIKISDLTYIYMRVIFLSESTNYFASRSRWKEATILGGSHQDGIQQHLQGYLGAQPFFLPLLLLFCFE
jgi:hypothetical protein